MIKLIKYENIIGVCLFWIFRLEFGVNKGAINSTFHIYIKLWKLSTFISLGKENKNAKNLKEAFKKPQSNDAFA